MSYRVCAYSSALLLALVSIACHGETVTLVSPEPDAKHPDAGAQDASQPAADTPDAAGPDASHAEPSAPDAGKPDAAKPDAAKPDAAKPDAAKPDAAKPDAAACAEGYEPCGDGSECVDIDECAREPSPCDPLTSCKNTPGSFECGPCPAGYTGTGDTACKPACGDLVEEGQNTQHWSASGLDVPPATATLSPLTADTVRGTQALRMVTTSGSDAWLRLDVDVPLEVSKTDELRIAVRARNANASGWQMEGPVVVLEDASAQRVTFTPTQQRLPVDGTRWTSLRIPLAGDALWRRSGPSLSPAGIRAIELHADTWDTGFALDVDALSFEPHDKICPCPLSCGAHGQCSADEVTCSCALGYAGPTCAACAPGFVQAGDDCHLPVDGKATEWPNAYSRASSDAWLQVHHAEIQVLRPKVLALNFVNPSKPADVEGLLQQIIAAFTEASRSQGYRAADTSPQLQYELLKTVDLRDGVAGRPAAPQGYPYENSTLFPFKGTRPLTGPGVAGAFDYAALFSERFAPYYGFADPSQPGRQLTLCELVQQGIVHEVWLVGSGDVPDVFAFEVLENKALYTATGNRIPDAYERCAGNGCFDSDVPVCGRSVRVGFVNYSRGPGCYVESLSHGLESAMNHRVAPQLSAWFTPFAGFDLDARYGLPFDSLYAPACTGGDCVRHPTPTRLEVLYAGQWLSVDPFDPVCGNVHFPPNARDDYDLSNSAPVTTSCVGYGRHQGAGGSDAMTMVSELDWNVYNELASDCMGPWLVWWWQNMPGNASGQTFADGTPMKSVWPFLYY